MSYILKTRTVNKPDTGVSVACSVLNTHSNNLNEFSWVDSLVKKDKI